LIHLGRKDHPDFYGNSEVKKGVVIDDQEEEREEEKEQIWDKISMSDLLQN
jgi:hypothetical protein